MNARSLLSGALVAMVVGATFAHRPALAASGDVQELRRQLEVLQKRIEQLENAPAKPADNAPAQVESKRTKPNYLSDEKAFKSAGAAAGDEGFQSKDQSGNDPRDFSSKFMPYYRYTELRNGVEAQELTLFGFWAFNTRFGMTYEFPVAKEIDYSGVGSYRRATAGGCPPGAGSGRLGPVGPNPGGGGNELFSSLDCDGNAVGLGDSTLRFFVRPRSLEWGWGPEKSRNFTLIPTLEMTVPTATEDVLGGDALIMSPGMTVVFDAPFNKPPFSLGFFAMMNFYDFDAWKENDTEDTSRFRGRWFWMQPLSKPTPEFKVFDTSGLYVMTELQPVYDFENDHFSFWFGPEFGKIVAPGHVLYAKPGFGVDPSADPSKGDRDWTFEMGYRYFFE